MNKYYTNNKFILILLASFCSVYLSACSLTSFCERNYCEMDYKAAGKISGPNGETIDLREYGYSSIVNAIIVNPAGVDKDGLLVLLGEIDSREARIALATLTEFDLGAAGKEHLSYSLVQQGKRILPHLKKQRGMSLICPTFTVVPNAAKKCSSVATRDKLLDWAIEAIEKEQKVKISW